MDPQRPLPQDAHGIRLPLPETGGGPEAMAGGYGKPDRKPMRHPVCGENELQSPAEEGKTIIGQGKRKTHQEETVREEPADPGPSPVLPHTETETGRPGRPIPGSGYQSLPGQPV